MVFHVGLGQFVIGQEVHILDFKTPHQIVASGTISGVSGIDKFHLRSIPPFFYKIDVTHVHIGDAPLMHPHEGGDQFCVRDAVGGNLLWSHKHLKGKE